ncbi:MBL fold metallo-hydrolase [Ornithinibacillus californiensis]|uniref:MBL fold metallo-hydrolase n=1 Tax=Ornithinibacillus californiensis TaxID=161536 RepID=UPI00064DB0C3|nr:MBL fold metallo-hydrolase [Ornithinibacillus californiensis]
MTVLNKTIHQLTVPTPFAVGDTHVYLLKGDTLSLIDAGVRTEDAWTALVEQLKEIGYKPSDIEQIILTHHHPDHTGLINRFERVNHIVGHRNVEPWLTRDEDYFNHFEAFYINYFEENGVPKRFRSHLFKLREQLKWAGEGELTNTIGEGNVLPGHPEFQVIETKGHAQSHVSFLGNDGTFIGGDHLLHHISPNPIMEPPAVGGKERPKPLLQYRANLEKCLTLDIGVVLPGHGKIFTDVEAVVSRVLSKQESRANKVLGLLKEYAQTPFQLCEQIFPRQFESQIDLTMSETIGQLDYLEDQGLVTNTIENGEFYYHAN